MKKMKTVLLLSAACAYFMVADVSLASLSDGVFLRGYASGAAKSTSVYTDTVLSHTHIRRVSSHTPFAAPAPLNLKTGTDDLFISTGAQGARSAFQAPISQQQTDGIDLPQVADRVKLRQLASVCFITDAGECSGGGAGIDEPSSSSSGPGPIEPEPGKQCALEGYVNDVCPEGQQPGLACPYDSGWHTGCVCKPEYNLTCSGSDEQGKGASCNGKYKECCKLCSGYDYTASNIPSGYVKGASCTGCDGVKYKIKCDTNASNTGTYIDCGSAAGSGGSCTDDTGTYYKNCECALTYEWSASAKKCVCASGYKYSCSGGNTAGGEGNSCDNKYQKCKCADGFVWDAASGQCLCRGTDWCSLNQDCGSLGYAQQSCSGKVLKCPFNTNYVVCL